MPGTTRNRRLPLTRLAKTTQNHTKRKVSKYQALSPTTRQLKKAQDAVVVEAADGKELLELYQKSLENNDEKNTKSKFDLIITDINMPPHNGDEAAKEIRKIEAKRIEVGGIENGRIENEEIERRIPIIALSGDGKQKDIHNFFASGMNDYFIKGSDPELLVKIVANYLAKL